MLLLDTVDVPPDRRGDAFRGALGQASLPSDVEPLPTGGGFSARVHVAQFGRASLLTVDTTGYRLVRTPQHVRMDAPRAASVLFKSRGQGVFSQFGRSSALDRSSLVLGDLTAPYTCSSVGPGRSHALRLYYDQLGLPVEVVRAAAGRLAASPLHAVVRNYLRHLADRAEELAADAGAVSLGTATTDLVRALIISAAEAEGTPRPAPAELLVSRVRAYVAAHLAEPDLSAARIAGTHNVSVRQLYKTCAAAGLSLERWIIDQRLESARTALASPEGQHRSIAATATACGFADPSHFGRRFRQAFGMTPRDWQRAARSAAA